MDARIGYPNEHLAPTNIENITSPMYSTGIGLVIKGFNNNYRNSDAFRDSTAAKNHSTKRQGGFFDKILKSGRAWFEEED